MTAHKHAALMALYAQDAAETPEPWLRWQVYEPHMPGFATMVTHPSWQISNEYRRKPKTIRIGEFDVPEPLRERPNDRTPLFLVYPTSTSILCGHVSTITYNIGDTNHVEWFRRGFLHETSEAAELHAKALISFTQVK